jgi:hypothetical protein
MASSVRLRFLFTSALIICFALWLRLTSLHSQPVFVDEANHLAWAQRYASGNYSYPLFMDGKFLMGLIAALFQPVGPGPLWVGRAAMGLTAIPGVAACIAGGALLGSRKTGLLAGLLCAVLPQAIFHERQLLADSLMGTMGSLAIIFTLQLARLPAHARRPAWPIVGLAASLAAAFVAKLFGLLYIIYPLLAMLWFGRRKRQALALGLGVLLTIAFLGALYPRWGDNDQKLVNQQVGFLQCPPLLCKGDLAGQIDNFGRALQTLAELVRAYVGWPLIVFVGLSLRRRKREVGFLFLGALGMLLAFLLAARDIPPRYMAFMVMPVAVLGAQGLFVVSRKSLALACALALLTLWPMANTAAIIADPIKADLPDLDRQSFTNGAMHTGMHEAALTILKREANTKLLPVILSVNSHFNSVSAYFDRTRVDVRPFDEAFPADLGQWLLNGQHIYIVEEQTTVDDSPPPELIVETIGRYPHFQSRTVRLQQIIGAEGSVRDKIFRTFFPDPDKLKPDYQALADALPQTEPLTLLVYPPAQMATLSPLLATHPNLTVRPIGESWPLAAATAADAEALKDADSINVVFLEETKGDPSRQLETWLNTQLFRLDEQWFGPIRMIRFAGRAGPGQKIVSGARFGDGFTLESVDVIDPVAAAGGVLRLRLYWRAGSTVSQQFKIFTHLFAGEGIVAQHDGQPAGELRPTNTWQTGETIIDQFAIRLPPDAQPGVYQLRIGMYDLNTQARLPVQLPDGAMGEFWVGGQIAVSQ